MKNDRCSRDIFPCLPLDDGVSTGKVDLSTQALDEDVDHVGHRIVGPVPYVLGNVRPAHHLAGPPDQILEQRVFAFRERDQLPSAGDAVRSRVDFEWPCRHSHGESRADSPSDERAQACVELPDVEGFGQVVVGTAVEPGDASFHAVPGGQHQDRHLGSDGPKALAKLQSVDERQHHVEDDGVVVGDCHQLDDLPAIGRDVHGVGLLPEPLGEHPRRVRFVLD